MVVFPRKVKSFGTIEKFSIYDFVFVGNHNLWAAKILRARWVTVDPDLTPVVLFRSEQKKMRQQGSTCNRYIYIRCKVSFCGPKECTVYALFQIYRYVDLDLLFSTQWKWNLYWVFCDGKKEVGTTCVCCGGKSMRFVHCCLTVEPPTLLMDVTPFTIIVAPPPWVFPENVTPPISPPLDVSPTDGWMLPAGTWQKVLFYTQITWPLHRTTLGVIIQMTSQAKLRYDCVQQRLFGNGPWCSWDNEAMPVKRIPVQCENFQVSRGWKRSGQMESCLCRRCNCPNSQESWLPRTITPGGFSDRIVIPHHNVGSAIHVCRGNPCLKTQFACLQKTSTPINSRNRSISVVDRRGWVHSTLDSISCFLFWLEVLFADN